MFLSISEESNLQTMSPFLTCVPSGTSWMILIWVALISQMPSTVTLLSMLPRSVTVMRSVSRAHGGDERAGVAAGDRPGGQDAEIRDGGNHRRAAATPSSRPASRLAYGGGPAGAKGPRTGGGGERRDRRSTGAASGLSPHLGGSEGPLLESVASGVGDWG